MSARSRRPPRVDWSGWASSAPTASRVSPSTCLLGALRLGTRAASPSRWASETSWRDTYARKTRTDESLTLQVWGLHPRSSASHSSQPSILGCEKSSAASVEGVTPRPSSHPM